MHESIPKASGNDNLDPFSVHRVVMHTHKGNEPESVSGRKPEVMVTPDVIPAIDDEDDDSEVGLLVAGAARRSSG